VNAVADIIVIIAGWGLVQVYDVMMCLLFYDKSSNPISPCFSIDAIYLILLS
jgi:hypothetical protein